MPQIISRPWGEFGRHFPDENTGNSVLLNPGSGKFLLRSPTLYDSREEGPYLMGISRKEKNEVLIHLLFPCSQDLGTGPRGPLCSLSWGWRGLGGPLVDWLLAHRSPGSFQALCRVRPWGCLQIFGHFCSCKFFWGETLLLILRVCNL